jgi:hypothetical protein
MKEPARAINKKGSALAGHFIHKVKSDTVLSKRSLNYSDSFQSKI